MGIEGDEMNADDKRMTVLEKLKARLTAGEEMVRSGAASEEQMVLEGTGEGPRFDLRDLRETINLVELGIACRENRVAEAYYRMQGRAEAFESIVARVVPLRKDDR